MSCARVLEGSSFLSRAAIALQSRRLGSAPSRKVAVHREGGERERERERRGEHVDAPTALLQKIPQICALPQIRHIVMVNRDAELLPRPPSKGTQRGERKVQDGERGRSASLGLGVVAHKTWHKAALHRERHMKRPSQSRGAQPKREPPGPAPRAPAPRLCPAISPA